MTSSRVSYYSFWQILEPSSKNQRTSYSIDTDPKGGRSLFRRGFESKGTLTTEEVVSSPLKIVRYLSTVKVCWGHLVTVRFRFGGQRVVEHIRGQLLWRRSSNGIISPLIILHEKTLVCRNTRNRVERYPIVLLPWKKKGPGHLNIKEVTSSKELGTIHRNT